MDLAPGANPAAAILKIEDGLFLAGEERQGQFYFLQPGIVAVGEAQPQLAGGLLGLSLSRSLGSGCGGSNYSLE